MQEIFGSYNCAPRKLILFRILSDSLSVIEQEDYTLHYTTLKGQIQVLIPKMFPIIRKKTFSIFQFNLNVYKFGGYFGHDFLL